MSRRVGGPSHGFPHPISPLKGELIAQGRRLYVRGHNVCSMFYKIPVKTVKMETVTAPEGGISVVRILHLGRPLILPGCQGGLAVWCLEERSRSSGRRS